VSDAGEDADGLLLARLGRMRNAWFQKQFGRAAGQREVEAPSEDGCTVPAGIRANTHPVATYPYRQRVRSHQVLAGPRLTLAIAAFEHLTVRRWNMARGEMARLGGATP
jgi:hypothetical protein